ncbi:carboxylesterase family protein [Vibrio sp. NH-UV-68]|uniref:carboxylesterase family protein n=1 Tax=unclassified Vibrio TaxID=2614977 RepID=UPI0036F19F94
MKITKRSILALTIAALLSACGSDDDSQPGAPAKPQPLKPLPSETINVAVGNADVTATKESLVITTVEGEEKLGSVESFKGITFAQAARFEHSDTANLEGSINATEFGNVCPQIKATVLEQSEDCLNLNIWRPEGTVEGDDLPVYVFIHGGDFEYGSGSNPMIHGDTVVAQGVDEGNPFIAVTFNYRLGLLGSNWIKGADVNGNYGLGDQETLLKWVQENIQDFGGNAGNVTLMGQGSGAMSIALLQQKVANSNLDETYFQRAVMQSVPYGFEYKSYNVAKDQVSDIENLRSASVSQIMEAQSTSLDPLQRLQNWLLSSLNIPLISPKSDNTPMATLMPYAPYLECSELKDGFLEDKSACKNDMGKAQPSQSEFVVPTVIGVNAQDADTMSILPNLTSLVPLIIDLMGNDTGDAEYTAQRMSEWLAIDGNKQLVEQRMQSLANSDEFSAQLELQDLIDALPSSAYEAITPLFFGLKNQTGSDLIQLTDFYPNDEHSVIGAIKNMSQYRTMMNDTLFAGPARIKAAQNDNATFYYFAHKPSFNVWTYNTGPNGATDIGDLLKSISCITGACNASELPFVFNKAVKLDGTSVKPNSKDKQLMNEMSRLWFSDKLFNDYQYDAAKDAVLLIDRDGINNSAPGWDKEENAGADPSLRQGRLSGLEELGILMNYLQN